MPWPQSVSNILSFEKSQNIIEIHTFSKKQPDSLTRHTPESSLLIDLPGSVSGEFSRESKVVSIMNILNETLF